jgi:large subunit ribosomal protein L10
VKREAKINLVRELRENFDRQKTVYLLDYTKMTVSQAVELRKLLRKNSYSFKVVKNRLALRALKDDIPPELRDYLQKPTAIAFAVEEPVKLARLLKDFSVQNKVLTFKGGLLDGQLVPPERFEEVCRLASREELLGKIAYLVAYPLTQLLRTWQAPLTNIGRLLSQLKNKK